ncbi:MAG: hypothetical protein IJ572_02300 [Bacilli bacterium]|nr:hypothetical protein [Bacilli bacterium]
MNPKFLAGLDLPKIIGGISKALGVINQAIPLYQQFKPILSNVKDISKIVNIINSPDNEKIELNDNIKDAKVNEIKKVSNNNLPTFFQ